MEHLKDKFPVGLVIAPTDNINGFYSQRFIPDSHVHYESKTEILQNVLKRQEHINDKNKAREAQGKPLIKDNAYIVMDVCLSQKADWAKDKTIYGLLFNGRHYHLTYVLTMQYPLDVSPDLRQNFDYVFLLADDNFENQKNYTNIMQDVFQGLNRFAKYLIN